MTLQQLLDEAARLGLPLDTPVAIFCECRKLDDVADVCANGLVLQVNTCGARAMMDATEPEEVVDAPEPRITLTLEPKLMPTFKGDKQRVSAYSDEDLVAIAPLTYQAKEIWKDSLRASGGDRGTCVLGAGIAIWYRPPRARFARSRVIVSSPGQSDCEGCSDLAMEFLREAGIYGVHFEYGRMD